MDQLRSSTDVSEVPLSNRGRPRLHSDATTRKQASRDAAKNRKAIKEVLNTKPDGPLIDPGVGVIETGGYDTTRLALIDAAHGHIEPDTILESDEENGESVLAGQPDKLITECRVTPEGHGPDDSEREDHSEDSPESDYSFDTKRKWVEFFGRSPQLGPTNINKSKMRLLCSRHSYVAGPCQGLKIDRDDRGRPLKGHIPDVEAFQDPVTGEWVLTYSARAKKSIWELDCGCTRPRNVKSTAKNIVTSSFAFAAEENEVQVF